MFLSHEDEADAVTQPIDDERLRAYLSTVGLPGSITVQQFPRGYSNLTYLLRVGQREVVLRRPPLGVKIAKAHDMGREFRILSALSSLTARGDVPFDRAPRPLALCEDESVLGAPFYVMERIPGVILRASLPAGLDLDDQKVEHLSNALLDTLLDIHDVDLESAGLTNFGKPEGYVERQVRGWIERYRAAQTDDIPEMDHIERWLLEHLPPTERVALVHNDFKYDNVVFDPALQKVVGVLDWEMATLGEPAMDLGCTLAYWVQASDPPGMHILRLGPTHLPGSSSRTELAERYQARSGRAIPDLPFYFAFALMKLAVVGQQLYKRYVNGLTRELRYARMLEGTVGLLRASEHVIATQQIDRLA